MLDLGELAHPRIGLAQRQALPLCQPDQDFAGAVEKPGIGREHHVLGLHRGVDDDTVEVGRFDRLGLGRNRKALCSANLPPDNPGRLCHAYRCRCPVR